MESPNSSYLALVGCYTDTAVLPHSPQNEHLGQGVTAFHFLDGHMKHLGTVPCLNPAVIFMHPRDRNMAYAVSECIDRPGTIHAISFGVRRGRGEGEGKEQGQGQGQEETKEGGTLSFSGQVAQSFDSKGKSTCYFTFNPYDPRYAIAINYWDGSVEVYRMDDKTGKCAEHVQHIEQVELSELGERRQVENRKDHLANRQVGAHAHSAHFYAQYVFIPDLGENTIFQYEWDFRAHRLVYQCQIRLHEGAGPRHMVFHPRLQVCYVSNELDSTVTVLEVGPGKGKAMLTPVQQVSTLPDNVNARDVKNSVAEILVSPDGRNLYVSNRGHDSLAAFRLQDDGRVCEGPGAYVPTHGNCPRHFNITPDGRFVVVANQDSNTLAVFRRSAEDGSLELLHKVSNEGTRCPNYVMFHPSPIYAKGGEKETKKGKL